MANEIRKLNFNITGYNYTRQDENAAKSAPEQKEKPIERNQGKISGSDVLNFMAMANADMIPVKTQKVVDVNKYVTTEQKSRIADFMKNFEADYDNAVQTAKDEFGVSEKVAGEIGLAYINSKY